jgi:hypothetical protein
MSYHYMMDRYFPDATKADGVRRESAGIKVMGDHQAISEAKLVAIWQRSD